jgi:hypothetical protein|tara:strand:- start:12560 stop:13033 length:474 start_codon:yes stop_codon:yes gene_type:complete
MLFLLAAPEYNNVQSNTSKVRVHLRTGVAEIFDQHQDLMGKVENNIIEIETNFEGKIEKFVFILQDAVFIVSNQGLDNEEVKGTSIYVYAKKAREINSSVSIDQISKEYDAKQLEVETQLANMGDRSNTSTNSKLILLQDDAEFLKKSLSIIKALRG